MKGAPAGWFEDAINDGLQGLVALRLDGAPPADTLVKTLDVWSLALWRHGAWIEQMDAGRFAAAFVKMAATLDRWPAPKAVLTHLPDRPERKALPNLNRDEHGREQLAELLERLKKDMSADRKKAQ